MTGKIHEVEDLFCHGDSAHRVVIYGGNVIGEHLSRQLACVDVDVTIIEPDRNKAEQLARAPPEGEHGARRRHRLREAQGRRSRSR